MSNLSELICGKVIAGSSGNLAQSLWHMSTTLSLLESEFHNLKSRRSAISPLATPFFLRSIIEVSCTSLIARLDPFRILTLAKIQGQSTYDTTQKISGAIQWKGDVVADRAKELWSIKIKSNDMTRALLGDYQDEIFWKPAFEKLLDYLQMTGKVGKSSWLAELVNIDITSIIPFLRGLASTAYSKTSKGVHHEFVLSISSYYDDATLDQLTYDVIKLVATMGLVVNFAENSHYNLTNSRAITCYKAIEP
ncbi:MAG TPA: hypothetical protein VMV35_05960 [Halothiobacillus sp.]|nr:hypothetical protein [Halothiobacillus sp.]